MKSETNIRSKSFFFSVMASQMTLSLPRKPGRDEDRKENPIEISSPWEDKREREREHPVRTCARMEVMGVIDLF